MPDLSINFTQEPVAPMNFGSHDATQAATPVGASEPALKVGPRITPSEDYGIGHTSAAGQQVDNSIGNSIANFFIGANTPPGEINSFDKLKLAKHSAMLDETKVRMAIQNQNDTHKAAEQMSQIQNQRMITHGFEIWQNIVGASAMMTMEQIQARIPTWKQMLKGTNPELESLPDTLGTKPWLPPGYSAMAEDADFGPIVQPLMSNRPMKDILADPTLESFSKVYGHDILSKITSRIPQATLEGAKAGKQTQEQFVKHFVDASNDTSLGATPAGKAFAKQFLLTTPEGEAYMVGWGVKTDKHLAAVANKEKPAGSQNLGDFKSQEFQKYKDILAHEEKFPGSTKPEVLADAKKNSNILLGLESKDQGINPQNSVIQRYQALATRHGIKADNIDEIKALDDGPVKKQALSLWNQAQAEKDKATAAGNQVVKMSSIHDSNAQPVFTMDSKGNPVKVDGEITQGEYLSGKFKGKPIFTMTPDQREKLGQITYAEGEGLAIFNLAEKAFTATTTSGRLGQTLLEKGMNNDLVAATLSGANPDLKVYGDEKNALLGKFSKSLGGEAGVLTNQDIARVVRMFPTGGDTAKIRQMKRDAFQRIIALNKKAINGLLVTNTGTEHEGIVTPEQMITLKYSQSMRDQIEGAIGQMEGIEKQAGAPLEGGHPVDRAASLIEEMRATKAKK